VAEAGDRRPDTGGQPGGPERDEPSKLRQLFEELQDRREQHRQEHGYAYRVVFALAGFTIFLGGVALLVLPGPAFAVIPIGLAMLALEFTWAERMLEIAIDKAELAGQTVKETSRRQKVLAAIAIALFAGAAVTAAMVWDIPLLPV
jgi:uncharacterized protein (TIGR02611 family)